VRDEKPKRFQIRYEGVHGDLGLTYHAALSELRPYLLSGWCALWETDEADQDILIMLSPERQARNAALCRANGPKGERCCEPAYHWRVG